jgi:predicted RNase H-like HicB family nuclease
VKVRDTLKLLAEEKMKKYLIVIERTDSGYSTYSPDLPGCVSTGKTREDAEKNMREAIEFHIEGLQQEGYPVPEPQTTSSYVELPV